MPIYFLNLEDEMSVNNHERHEMVCAGCHKRVAVKGARLCRRCLNIAKAEAQLTALHIAEMREEMSEARNG